MTLDVDDIIPEHLSRRPRGPQKIDHIALAREAFVNQLDMATAALKIIDLRMESTEEEIARLHRQQADDRREAAALESARRAAQRALATLDGAEP